MIFIFPGEFDINLKVSKEYGVKLLMLRIDISAYLWGNDRRNDGRKNVTCKTKRRVTGKFRPNNINQQNETKKN